MTWGEITAVAVLGIWLGASVVGQIGFGARLGVRRWDPLGLIPMWWFFAPNPARGDFYFLYRDQLKDGSVTDWTEVKVGVTRRWWNLVWNPSRRERKALFDIVTSLARRAQETTDVTVQVSLPYLALLNYVSRLARTEASVSTQFMLMQTEADSPDEPPAAVFLSRIHRLSD